VGYGSAALVPGITAEAHSVTAAELTGSGGLALALLGALLIVLDGADGARPWAGLVLAPLTALGRVALTVYTAHVIIIATLSPFGPAGSFASPVGEILAALLIVGGVLFALACTALARRGPLEALLGAASGAASGQSSLPRSAREVED
jgi:uncharacterized membrane protein YeiB